MFTDYVQKDSTPVLKDGRFVSPRIKLSDLKSDDERSDGDKLAVNSILNNMAYL